MRADGFGRRDRSQVQHRRGDQGRRLAQRSGEPARTLAQGRARGHRSRSRKPTRTGSRSAAVATTPASPAGSETRRPLSEPPEDPLCAVPSEMFATLLRSGSYAFPAAVDASVATAGAQIEVEGGSVRIVSSDHSRLAYSSATLGDGDGAAPGGKQAFGLGMKAISELTPAGAERRLRNALFRRGESPLPRVRTPAAGVRQARRSAARVRARDPARLSDPDSHKPGGAAGRRPGRSSRSRPGTSTGPSSISATSPFGSTSRRCGERRSRKSRSRRRRVLR